MLSFTVYVNVDVDVEAYREEYGLPFTTDDEVELDIANMVKNSLDNDLPIFSHFLSYEVEGV